MKAVILAGGLGTRFSEETSLRPKPLIEIGEYPILWHLMRSYAAHGIKEFIICVGYKGYLIKEFFINYHRHVHDVQVDLASNSVSFFGDKYNSDDWKITVVDTGKNSMTGGRLLCIRSFVEDDDAFCMTYGDGLSDLDITESIKFHKQHGKIATIGAVSPPGRFGALDIKGTLVESFIEKPLGDNTFINGGYFVFSPKIFDYLKGDTCVLEKKPLEQLASEKQLEAFIHKGFWQCMDTLRDKNYLEKLWESGNAPWIVSGKNDLQ